jgi:hypothetical protein
VKISIPDTGEASYLLELLHGKEEMSNHNFEIDPTITVEGIIASILDASEQWDLLECKTTNPGKLLLRYRPSDQLFQLEVIELPAEKKNF